VDCAVVSKVFPDFGFAFDSHSLSWLFTWFSYYSFTFTFTSSFLFAAR
jgi:hypothetical protein